MKGFGADGVFNEERSEIFDLVATADGIVEVEALVEVDDPFAIFADAFARSGTLVAEMRDALARVVGGIGGKVAGTEAEGAIAGFDGERARSWMAMPGMTPGCCRRCCNTRSSCGPCRREADEPGVLELCP